MPLAESKAPHPGGLVCRLWNPLQLLDYEHCEFLLIGYQPPASERVEEALEEAAQHVHGGYESEEQGLEALKQSVKVRVLRRRRPVDPCQSDVDPNDFMSMHVTWPGN
jgi:hypothetical protein